MQELMTSAMALAVEINRITAGCGPPRELPGLWDPLREIVPFSAAWLGVLDGLGHRFLTAAALGHDAAARTYIESRGYRSKVESSGVLAGRRPIRLRTDGRPSAFPSPEGLWSSAGQHDGLGMPLIAMDGRPVGLLILLTEATGQPSDPDCQVIGKMAPMITAAIDPMNSITGLAGLVVDARASAVIGPGSAVHPLPGSPAHPLLATGRRVVAIASERLRTHGSPTSFLYPDPSRETDDYLRITVIACPPIPSSPFVQLMIASPPGDLHGLTRRELEVLGLVIDGATNRQIASTLFITQRTVAAHLEHIRVKLDAPTRTAAAVRSLDHALFLPPNLAGPHD
ncbi:helix-turn-helix transcriptional regulator [Actinoplanes sp. KI2]|uniref:response regulator transcription factor n=1 Tax=Actinoplanes sp. KI2 TaxID=2983315 RepID=UPI0021D59C22|nr:helix-turn-helix transcriptional regulator [Actinoplanes sp. KI2]MCU7730815.1 helix-turn-helix transcriptional regulator [Actinoplanes sp. KI2]